MSGEAFLPADGRLQPAFNPWPFALPVGDGKPGGQRVAELRDLVDRLDQVAAGTMHLGTIREARNELAALAEALESGQVGPGYAAVPIVTNDRDEQPVPLTDAAPVGAPVPPPSDDGGPADE